MILFTILMITLFLLVVFIVLIAGVAGAVGVVIFGDVIVCIVMIMIAMRVIIKKRNKDEES